MQQLGCRAAFTRTRWQRRAPGPSTQKSNDTRQQSGHGSRGAVSVCYTSQLRLTTNQATVQLRTDPHASCSSNIPDRCWEANSQLQGEHVTQSNLSARDSDSLTSATTSQPEQLAVARRKKGLLCHKVTPQQRGSPGHHSGRDTVADTM